MNPLSNILLVLLYFAKRDAMRLSEKMTWKHVRDSLKHADYDQAEHMKLGSLLSLVIPAYMEAVGHPELRVPGGANNALVNVIAAPFASHFALKWPHWNMQLQDEYPLEDVYNAMLQQLISDLSLTTVAGCPQYCDYSDLRDEQALDEQDA